MRQACFSLALRSYLRLGQAGNKVFLLAVLCTTVVQREIRHESQLNTSGSSKVCNKKMVVLLFIFELALRTPLVY